MIVAGVLALVYPVEGVSLEFFVTDWLHRAPLLIASRNRVKRIRSGSSDAWHDGAK